MWLALYFFAFHFVFIKAWRPTEGEMEILRWTKISMDREMCGVQLRDRQRSKDLMLSWNETIDQLAMANSVCWHGHVLRRKDVHVLRRAVDVEGEGQRKKGRLKRTWKKQKKV